jgi:uncharacterized membrane protein YcaP (DUF421 family)
MGMNAFIIEVFGKGQDLNAWQMTARAIVMFFITLALIRVGGLRIFGKRDAFDNIIGIMMGAILSRGVTGASSFVSVVIATTAMILIHRVLSALAFRSRFIEKTIKGTSITLYENGVLFRNNLYKASMTMHDLMESLRLETQKDSLEDVQRATMETNGRISFVLKKSAQ